ncbi:hypothetical protein HMPREF1557_00839 [Streptococcus sobrinus W1703]|uniref:Uncharacterized protein n=1 Tax=Streptococcus sobrinus W1703 TaxID=1227275 RepID=U2IRU9_9STRE|nr:hypothetical protein HMPREF1557_00839 [Streptococcus sobrinus W1703]
MSRFFRKKTILCINNNFLSILITVDENQSLNLDIFLGINFFTFRNRKRVNERYAH